MISIRKAKPEDAKRLCELGNEFLRHLENGSPLLRLERLTLSNPTVLSWKKGIEKPPRGFYTFVAEIDGFIVGYMELMIKDNEPKRFFKIKRFGCIEALMVDKKYQRQKVGKGLYDYAMQFFKNNKLPYVRISVFLKNTAGHRFWLTNGFKEESADMIKKL